MDEFKDDEGQYDLNVSVRFTVLLTILVYYLSPAEKLTAEERDKSLL